MSSWTIDRLLLEPKEALRQLQEHARLTRDANKRINDLLAANNRYLEDGREARRQVKALEFEISSLRNSLKLRH